MTIMIPRPLEAAGRMPCLFRARTPRQWLDFVARRPGHPMASADQVELRQEHVDFLRELAFRGRRAYGPDRPHSDHWDDAPPFVNGVQTPGFDCENLALWVRRVMDEEFEDWPLGAGRPALCRLPDGRAHCVLVVVTSNYGDLVVGSQPAEDVVAWESLAGYTWFSRLHAGSEWRLISAPKPAPMAVAEAS